MADSGISLKWLGTAGFLLRFSGAELLLDPYLSRLPGARPAIRFSLQDFRSVSLILVSHGHFDHAMDAARIARMSGARVQAPRKTCGLLKKQGVTPSLLHANETNPAFSWNGARIRAVPSRHIVFDLPVVRKTAGLALRGGSWSRILPLILKYPAGSNSEFLLDFDGYRILFSGSGGGNWDRLARLKPHGCLIPFAGRSDLVDYYLDAMLKVRPEVVVLHHFDRFFPSFVVDYPVEEFREAFARALPGIRLIVPEVMEPFCLPGPGG